MLDRNIEGKWVYAGGVMWKESRTKQNFGSVPDVERLSIVEQSVRKVIGADMETTAPR